MNCVNKFNKSFLHIIKSYEILKAQEEFQLDEISKTSTR